MSEVTIPKIMYFFPDDDLSDPEDTGRELCSRGSAGALGPDEKHGQIWSEQSNAVLHYNERSQIWRRVFGGYYVGYAKNYTPADFARERQFDGYMVELTDGQEWLIPIANPMYDTCGLPFVEVRDVETGKWTKEVKEQYKALSDQALDVAARIRRTLEGEPLVFTAAEGGEDEVRRLFCRILAVNYDLTPTEIEALRLCDPSRYVAVLSAFVDWPKMQEFLLHTMGGVADVPQNPTEAPDGSSTASGEMED